MRFLTFVHNDSIKKCNYCKSKNLDKKKSTSRWKYLVGLYRLVLANSKDEQWKVLCRSLVLS